MGNQEQFNYSGNKSDKLWIGELIENLVINLLPVNIASKP